MLLEGELGMKYKFTDWIGHDGGPMPVPAETYVLVRFGRDWSSKDETPEGFMKDYFYTAGFWESDSSNWTSTSSDGITAYRILIGEEER